MPPLPPTHREAIREIFLKLRAEYTTREAANLLRIGLGELLAWTEDGRLHVEFKRKRRQLGGPRHSMVPWKELASAARTPFPRSPHWSSATGRRSSVQDRERFSLGERRHRWVSVTDCHAVTIFLNINTCWKLSEIGVTMKKRNARPPAKKNRASSNSKRRG